MDKNAIKKYAVWAREELIEKVTARAVKYDIVKDKELNPSLDSINGEVLSESEKNERKALIKKINEDGYDQVMEEVAYTWFNRFIAIRFMEVNGYLPSHIRVFSNENGEFRPQILSEAIHLEMPGLDMEKVLAYKEDSNEDELFKYLLKAQCNALNDILPQMFQKLEDYTELLLPDYLLREGSVIEALINDIPEDNFDISSDNGQIEIIGWMYQYYISAKHDEVVDPLHGKVVKKEEVPAATQLFTTDWVVRYLIDNSVGRYWIERNPESQLAKELTYFVTPKDGQIKYVDEKITPQDVTVFDPCVGSGHFLVYAFEVLMKIYVEYGFSERDAASEIVKNNIFGLDIDGRATQLAYFAVMMKARQYDRRFFTRGIQPQIYEIMESNNADISSIQYFYGNDSKLQNDVKLILDTLHDAKEYGSILQMPEVDFDKIAERFNELENEVNLYNPYLFGNFRTFINEAEVLGKKYAVVATNPPYLNKYDDNLKKFIVDNYKDYKGDLFSVFIYKNIESCIVGGYAAYMTPMVWMFISTYEKLRKHIVENKDIITLIQFEYSAYEEATVPICSFVVRNRRTDGLGYYFKLSEYKGGMDIQRQKVIDAIIAPQNSDYFYETIQDNYCKIPGYTIAYWLSNKFINLLSQEKTIGAEYESGSGLSTSDNERFLRYFWEVDNNKIADGKDDNKKWYLFHKGGEYRKWYGNLYYVVNWENDGEEIKYWVTHNPKDPNTTSWSRRIFNTHLYFMRGVTWSVISSGDISFRAIDTDAMISNAAGGIFGFDSDEDRDSFMAAINTKIWTQVFATINPTINYSSGVIQKAPCPNVIKNDLGTKCRNISKNEWDSYETSYGFKIHPLIDNVIIGGNEKIKDIFKRWEEKTNEQFNLLKEYEEEINRIYISAYDMEGEISHTVSDEDINLRKADLEKDIRSLLSYAVGCMFGRYSLDEKGIVYAGGEWDVSRYKIFVPDADAIIPICDDEYFADDIVGRFIEFIETVYGKDTLEENLQFIAEALGGNGSSRAVIRNYFLNDFYADHVKTYQKRPIYWLFNSGKKNGFKCLIYIHRYQPDTIARIRTDYVHEQQARYRTAIEETTNRIQSANGSDKVKLTKKLNTLKAQDEEIHAYEEKIHHLADQMISIDLDDGVKHNYEIFKDVLAKIK